MMQTVQEAFEEYRRVHDKEPAVAALYQHFLTHAKRVVFSMLGEDNQELAHDIAVKGCIELEKFKGRSKISTWFHSVVVNECLMELRSRKARNEKSLEELTTQEFVQLVSDAASDAPVDWQGIAEVLDDLDNTVLSMKLDGYSAKEIARATGLSKGGVKTRWRRLRKSLKGRNDVGKILGL